MEFSEILAAAYEDLGYQSSPASDVVTRIKRYVNEGLQSILGEPALYGLLEADTPYTFTATASRAQYSIPDGHAFIRQVVDTTNDRVLESMPLSDYRRVSQDLSLTGTPTHWVPLGRVAVALQPSDASELFIDSTSGSDTGTCYLEGIITGGYRRTASVTMTGTTAVSLSAAITSWIEVTDLYLSAAAVGTVTLHEDASGGTELARITIGQKRPSYQGFLLWPSPSGAFVYDVDTRRDLDLLVNNTDEPPMPRDFHPMLIDYAVSREWQKKDDDRYESRQQRYDKWLSRLKYRLHGSGDSVVVARAGRGHGLSRLGAYFPVDTVVRP